MLVKPSSTSPLPNEPVFRLNVKFWEICSKGSCWKIFCSCTALLKHEHLYSHMISKEFPDPKSCFFLGSGVLDLFGIFVGDLKHTIYPNMCIIHTPASGAPLPSHSSHPDDISPAVQKSKTNGLFNHHHHVYFRENQHVPWKIVLAKLKLLLKWSLEIGDMLAVFKGVPF